MPDQPPPGCDSQRLPLVLGVTGHRDLRAEDLPQLTARLDQFLEALKRRCPSTPLVLLSSLAEGADRLVAKVALRHQAELIAPLPLPPEQCLEDFKSPASKAEFQELLQRASGWFVVPTPEEVADAGTPEGRDRCYEQMGAFIAARCQFLIALWNGEFNQLRGGTGHIVQMCREGIPTPWVIRDSALDFPEKRTLVWIVTPRQGNPTTARPAFEITPDPAKFPGDIRRLCELTDGYNRDLARHPSAGQASVEVLEPANSSLAGQALQVAEQLLAKSLAQADTLAVLYARRTRKLLAGILMLTFCAAVAYQLLATQWFGRYWTQGPGAAGESALMPLRLAYAGLLLGILACYLFSIRTNYHCKYLDYRALAEGLRVQWFWCGARIAEPVADHYLRKQRGLLDWLQTALRATVVLCEGRSGCSLRALLEQRPVPLELMLSKWVDDQRHYYRQQASKHQRSAQRLRLVWQTTVIAGVLLGILKAGKGLQNGWDLNDHPLVVLVVLATAAIGLWKIQSKTNANSEMAKQFAHMSQVFDEASRLIRASLDRGDLAAARELMRELGKEALAEHGEWLLLHRQRPIELPKA